MGGKAGCETEQLLRGVGRGEGSNHRRSNQGGPLRGGDIEDGT